MNKPTFLIATLASVGIASAAPDLGVTSKASPETVAALLRCACPNPAVDIEAACKARVLRPADEAPASKYCAREGEEIHERIERLETALRLARAELVVNRKRGRK